MKPLLLVLGLVAAGLVGVAGFGWWRIGSGVVGVAFCVGAMLRLTLPKDRLGDLAVRSRGLDAAVLLTVGFGLVAFANTIPRRH